MHIINSCNSSLSNSAVVVLGDALVVDFVVVDGAVVVGNLTNDKRFDPLHRFNPNSLKSEVYFLEIIVYIPFYIQQKAQKYQHLLN